MLCSATNVRMLNSKVHKKFIKEFVFINHFGSSQMYEHFSQHGNTASWLPVLPPPCRNASGIDYPSKKLSKMAGYSASYSFNSWCIGRVYYRIVANFYER